MDQMQLLINQTLAQLTQLRIEHYMSVVLFSWQWLTFLCAFIVSWYIWWRLVDKRRLRTIIIFGLVSALLNSISDEHLLNLGMYVYPFPLDPIWAGALTGEISATPIVGMLLYQYFPKWKTYTLAILIASAILAFVILPIYMLMGAFVLLKWKYLYSFVVLLIIKILSKWLTDMIVGTELKHNS